MVKNTFKILVFILLVSGISNDLAGQAVTSPKTGIDVGNLAPNITMKDTNGNDLSLYDLKGSLVFISFWAAWCRPCRYENKALVEAFNTFKGKEFRNADGFRIFSVSLDKNRENWMAAIHRDGLAWSEHVSSLQGWESPVAKTYDITSIPANLLLNADGVIIAKNISIDQLNKMLETMIR